MLKNYMQAHSLGKPLMYRIAIMRLVAPLQLGHHCKMMHSCASHCLLNPSLVVALKVVQPRIVNCSPKEHEGKHVVHSMTFRYSARVLVCVLPGGVVEVVHKPFVPASVPAHMPLQSCY